MQQLVTFFCKRRVAMVCDELVEAGKEAVVAHNLLRTTSKEFNDITTNQ
jgi:hypothetical protein